MGLREELKRLRVKVQGAPESFLLVDGSRFFFDPSTDGISRFKHASECVHADGDGLPRPAPLPIYRAVCKAANRARAVERLFPSWRERNSKAMVPYDLRVLVEEGRLVHQRFAPGYEPLEPEPEPEPEVEE
jgi:hypothetical protein